MDESESKANKVLRKVIVVLYHVSQNVFSTK